MTALGRTGGIAPVRSYYLRKSSAGQRPGESTTLLSVQKPKPDLYPNSVQLRELEKMRLTNPFQVLVKKPSFEFLLGFGEVLSVLSASAWLWFSMSSCGVRGATIRSLWQPGSLMANAEVDDFCKFCMVFIRLLNSETDRVGKRDVNPFVLLKLRRNLVEILVWWEQGSLYSWPKFFWLFFF